MAIQTIGPKGYNRFCMDPDILRLPERLTIELGDSHFREFKSALEGPPGNKRPRIPAMFVTTFPKPSWHLPTLTVEN